VKKIKIECQGQELVDISELTPLQGNLKELSEINYNKLKNSILKYGFSFPAFVWRYENKKYILDAHQRLFTLKKMINEGYELQDNKIPVVYIQAVDKREAKEKLLQLNSQYGKITDEGMYEFINEIDSELNIEDLSKDLNLPDFDLDYFVDGWVNEKGVEVDESEYSCLMDNEIREKEIDENSIKTSNECPNCGYKW